MKGTRWFSLVCFLLIAAALLSFTSACATPSPSQSSSAPVSPQANSQPAAGAKTVRIGVLVALSGWFSSFDELEWQEAQLARDMLNEKGGITVNGQKYTIELVPEDIKSTADGTQAGATKLVNDEQVKFIAGPAAFFSSAAKDVTEPAKVLRAISFTTDTPGEFGPDTPYTFLSHNASIEHAIVGVKYLKKAYPQVKTLAFVMPDDGSIPYLDPKIRALFKDNGLNVVGDTISYPNEMVDFSPVAAKIVATKADAVFLENGIAPAAGSLLKGIRALGSKMPFAGAMSGSGGEIMAVSGKDAATDFFIISPFPGDPNNPPLMQEVLKRLSDKYGSDRSIHLQIFNSIWEIARAIEAAQSLDPAVVREKWSKMDTIETVYGTGHIGGQVTYGIRQAVSHPEPVEYLDDGVVKDGGWIDVTVP